MITGHRGAAALAPENTLASIQKAAESGIKWIEIDTQLSADNIPVIIHDQTVQRCTNGKGLVGELTLAELKGLDAGSWFASEFTGETIPTLKEALLVCQENDLNMNLEIKIYSEDEIKSLVERVVETVKVLNFPIDKLLFSSFSQTALKHCQALYPGVRRGFITKNKPSDMLVSIKPLALYSLHIDHRILNETLAESIKEAGLTLMIWTLNDPKQIDKYTAWGVDNIITDKPHKFNR
ncbi:MULTISPECIES: glycerophosphoryl diester phosphodiesterase [unclassified Moritella]|uniref:glycerophosphoryl diester phosphodiesterase n=1 Tax=unclassified Moritella TaxID=2637987 RepID=UPI001BAD8A2F|nr:MULTISPECIES: glycerophosphoryl diester phosphodiesterase [unclassified Moritella]QUM86752.1 glycerophosphoryl diester phosphodiesterase [Moritella sp. 28]QUM90979.1 glycerophosphoryl diester phosphodiesterase [Moritella sp. 36]